MMSHWGDLSSVQMQLSVCQPDTLVHSWNEEEFYLFCFVLFFLKWYSSSIGNMLNLNGIFSEPGTIQSLFHHL